MKIEVKKIVPEAKISWLWTLIFWSIFAGIIIMLIPGLVAVFVVVFALPVTRFIHRELMARSVLAESEMRFQEFVGPNADYINTTIAPVPGRDNRFSGTGIGFRDGKIYMMHAGVAAQIPWNSVRSWWYEIQGIERSLVSVTNHAGVAVPHYADNSADALRRSGFFVRVADIDHPEWQFQTMDESLVRKWLEIFNQINEGKIQAS